MQRVPGPTDKQVWCFLHQHGRTHTTMYALHINALVNLLLHLRVCVCQIQSLLVHNHFQLLVVCNRLSIP